MQKTSLNLATLTSILVIVFLLESLTLVNVTNANPFPLNSTPDLDLPVRVIQSPQNYSIYQSSSVPINVTITEPSTWKKHYTPSTDDYIQSMNVFLDGNVTRQLSVGYNLFYLNNLAIGLHTMNIKVVSYTYYAGPFINGSEATNIHYSETNSNGVYVPRPVYKYPLVASDTVYFTVQQPTPETATNNLLSQLIVGAIIVFVVIFSIIAIIIYWRRTKV